MAEEVILLNWWVSPFAMRVRITQGKQSLWEEDALGNKSPLLLKSSPVHKKIPVLIHNSKPVSESLVILQYIDENWSHNSPLIPSHHYDRARARFWADFVDKKLYTNGRGVWEGKGEDKQAAKKELIETLKLLQGALGEKAYFGGESFGYVDVALVPFYSWFYALEKIGDFSIEEECPKLSVSGVLPDQEKIYDLILNIKGEAIGTLGREAHHLLQLKLSITKSAKCE